jgi:ABC-type transporter Mla subunit MlaD
MHLAVIPDLANLIQTVAASMAVLLAGAGLYRLTHSGAQFFERAESKVMQVADTFLSTQVRITVAQEKQATALESTANLIPLLENINESQRQIGGTLRAMNRKLQELEDLRHEVISKLRIERGRGSDDTTLPLDRS